MAPKIRTKSAFYDLISEARQRLKTTVCKSDCDDLNTQVKKVSTGAIGKLPDLSLPTFLGNYETWFSFKDMFNSLVDSRTDLSDTDKFLYLKLCCKNDALKLINSLDITANNYAIALNLLTSMKTRKLS